MEPSWRPARRKREQGEREKVATVEEKARGVTSEQEGEKRERQESMARTTAEEQAVPRVAGLVCTGGPLESIVAMVTTWGTGVQGGI